MLPLVAHTNLIEIRSRSTSQFELRDTLHGLSGFLSRSSSENPCLTMTFWIAFSSGAVLNLARMLPCRFTLNVFLSEKMVSHRRRYDSIQLLTSISSRPSIMAMRLFHSQRNILYRHRKADTYPPVLVPPMTSKYSHGFGGCSASMLSISR